MPKLNLSRSNAVISSHPLKLLNTFFRYVQGVERNNFTGLTPLLDELNRTAAILFARVGSTARLCTSAKDNGTNDIRDAGPEWWTHSNKRGETFLTSAWAVGHRSYVREKIEADVPFVVRKQGRPMLDCILRLGLRADSGFKQ